MFASKIVPFSFKPGDKIIKEACQFDPICILYDGEVEDMETGRIIKPNQLIWEIECEPLIRNHNNIYIARKGGIGLKMTKYAYMNILAVRLFL